MSRQANHGKKRAPRKTKIRAIPANYKTPVVRLLEKPYEEWTPKQLEWLEKIYRRLFLPVRGRKRKTGYDVLFRERELATARLRFPGIFGPDRQPSSRKVPSYTELATRAAGVPVSAKPEEEDPARQRFIRAYQRRKQAERLPNPPKR